MGTWWINFYLSGEYGAVELGLDESGLWASFCQNDTHGNIVLSRLDLYSLEPRRTYHSTLHRNWLYNSFVACGVYYGIRHYEKGNQLIVKVIRLESNQLNFLSPISDP